MSHAIWTEEQQLFIADNIARSHFRQWLPKFKKKFTEHSNESIASYLECRYGLTPSKTDWICIEDLNKKLNMPKETLEDLSLISNSVHLIVKGNSLFRGQYVPLNGLRLFTRKYPDKFTTVNPKQLATFLKGSANGNAIQKEFTIRCIETGEIYESCADAGRKLFIDPSRIARAVREGIPILSLGKTFESVSRKSKSKSKIKK
jgi:hypothetical protein